MPNFQVVEAANVVCLRRSRVPRTYTVATINFARDDDGSAIRHIFERNNGQVTFRSGWQVLMGQGEVKNWLRSTPEKTVLMRYAGEFKFAGGTKDAGETLEETAIRELREEFVISVDPRQARLRLFNIKQTKPVRNRSYMMHNFVALEEENEWLQHLDVDIINSRLEGRRRRHVELMASGTYYTLSDEEKSRLSPEVYACAWLDIGQACEMSMTSNCEAFVPCNEWQQEQFELYGVVRRDPMFQTMSTLLELENHSSTESLIAHCEALSAKDARAPPPASGRK